MDTMKKLKNSNGKIFWNINLMTLCWKKTEDLNRRNSWEPILIEARLANNNRLSRGQLTNLTADRRPQFGTRKPPHPEITPRIMGDWNRDSPQYEQIRGYRENRLRLSKIVRPTNVSEYVAWQKILQQLTEKLLSLTDESKVSSRKKGRTGTTHCCPILIVDSSSSQ